MSNSVKNAASVIVFGKSVFSNSTSKLRNVNIGEKYIAPYDYKILVVKRASKSSFMPNAIVFPGGIYNEADASRDWLKLYREMNMSLDKYPIESNTFSIEKKVRAENALAFNNNDDYLPNNFAFRITAIRELFEECGLLLAKKVDYQLEKECRSRCWASYIHSHEILKWQQRVQRNPREFIQLCEEFNCVPDIWSLKDWSIWLTPIHMPKRFDTTFFVAGLNQIPPTVPDHKELSELKWREAAQLLEEFKTRGIWLPPPQFYELSRIAKNFHQVEQLLDYSNAWCGCPRWMPLGIKAADGWVFLLPGDEMYPAKPVFFKPEADIKMEKNQSELNMAELRHNCSRLHRMEIKDSYTVNIVISHYPSTDHVYPEQSLSNPCS